MSQSETMDTGEGTESGAPRDKASSPAMRSLMYAVATILPRAVGFLLLPLYASHMTPAAYGLVASIDVFSTYLGLTVNAGFSNALLRFFYEEDSAGWRKKIFSTCLTSALSTAAAATVLAFLVLQAVDLIASLGDIKIFLLIATATVAIEALNGCVWTLYRVEERAQRAMFMTITRLIVAVALNVLFIAVLEMTVLGFLLSNLIVALFAFAVFGIPEIVTHWASPTLVLWKKMLSFALPYIPIGFIEAFVNNLGVICLTFTGSLSAVGLYAIGTKMASIITLCYAPINTVWMPLMYKQFKAGDARAYYSRSTSYILIYIMSVTVGVIALGGPLLVAVTPDAYSSAAAIIIPLAVGTGIYALRTNVRVGFTLKHKTKLLPIYTVVPVAIAFPITMFLAWKVGTVGTALGVSFAMILTIGLTARKSREYFPADYDWPRIFRLLMAVGLAILLTLLTGQQDILARMGILILYFLSLFALRVLRLDEISTLRAMFRPAAV
jgi:O-antigen/teichoic acid export membrane protein